MANSDERAGRLAAQLRANLHRRKAQARAVDAAARVQDAPPREQPTEPPRD